MHSQDTTGGSPADRGVAEIASNVRALAGTHAERSMRARIAAHSRLANASDGDRRAMTAAARRAFADRWERQVDPDGVLTPEERSRRAEHAKSAHFQRMALKSAQMRRRRRAV